MNTIQAVMGLMLLGAGDASINTEGMNNAFIPEVSNTKEAVVLKVMSNGCTRKKDFRVRVSRNQSLQVIRLKKDRCRNDPRTIELHYTHNELGLDKPVTLPGNRVAGN